MPPSPPGEGFCAHSVPSDAITERRSPLPSSGLRGTPDATLPSRGGILRAVRSDGRKTGTSSTQSFPLRGRCRRRRRKRCRTKKQSVPSDAQAERRSPLPSSGLRGTPDATLPSRGGIFARSPLRRAQKRDEFRSQVLPLEGKVAPQATEEVPYQKAFRSVGCTSGTKTTSSVIRLAWDAGCHPPLKGRDFTRRSVPAS